MRTKVGDLFLIKDTGIVLKYLGKICEDYHKAKYDDEYRVIHVGTKQNSNFQVKIRVNDLLWGSDLNYYGVVLEDITDQQYSQLLYDNVAENLYGED